MNYAFHYRPRFVDIRVRPPKIDEAQDEPPQHDLKPGERACDHAGCRTPAATRAPKSRDLMNEHYWFCQVHAAEYNRSWNFFSGLSEAQISDRLADDLATGGRPTWSFMSGARNKEAAGNRGVFRDNFGIFNADKARAKDDQAALERRLGRLERGALSDLGLDATADAATVRARYIEMVKLCHPDANGGDRSAEHKLQRVLKAYKTLRKAKLV